MSDKRRRREREAPREEIIAPSVSDRALFPFFSAARFPSLHFFASCFLLSRCPVPQEPHCDSRSFEGTDHIAVLAPEAEPNARTSTTRRPSMVSAVGTLEPLKFLPSGDRSLAALLHRLCLLQRRREEERLSPWSWRGQGCCPCWRHCPCPGRSRDPRRPCSQKGRGEGRDREEGKGASTASRVSFFLSFVQHEDFFFRPRFSTLFSNG